MGKHLDKTKNNITVCDLMFNVGVLRITQLYGSDRNQGLSQGSDHFSDKQKVKRVTGK